MAANEIGVEVDHLNNTPVTYTTMNRLGRSLQVNKDIIAAALGAGASAVLDGWQVTAGAGLSVDVAAGRGASISASHRTLLETTASVNVPGLTASSTLYLFGVPAFTTSAATDSRQSGAVTFTAQAGSVLAGGILIAVLTTSGSAVTAVDMTVRNLAYSAKVPVRIVTAAATIAATDNTIEADATGGTFDLTLPSVTAVPGQTFFVQRINSGANAVTLQRAGTDTISGATSYALTAQWKSVTLRSNGVSRWIIVAAT